MRPPGATEDVDPGLTNRSRETQAEQRLDYICRFKTLDGVDLVAHHMRVGHRDPSDHYALEAIIQQRDDHCQPTSAVDIDAAGPVAGTSGPGQPQTSLAYYVLPDISVDDGRSWDVDPARGHLHVPPQPVAGRRGLRRERHLPAVDATRLPVDLRRARRRRPCAYREFEGDDRPGGLDLREPLAAPGLDAHQGRRPGQRRARGARAPRRQQGDRDRPAAASGRAGAVPAEPAARR